MTSKILAALHALFTGCAVPTVRPPGAALVCCPGIGALAGVNVVFGSDRYKRGVNEKYFPLLIIDDDSGKYKGDDSVHGVQITIAVCVPPYLGGLMGCQGEDGYTLGLLDIIEAALKTIIANKYLPDPAGGYLTTGIYQDNIEVSRDADIGADAVKMQLAAIAYAYCGYCIAK